MINIIGTIIGIALGNYIISGLMDHKPPYYDYYNEKHQVYCEAKQ